MRFIVVNDRAPFKVKHCICCSTELANGYLREFQTGLFYCPVWCFQFSEQQATLAIEEARRAS